MPQLNIQLNNNTDDKIESSIQKKITEDSKFNYQSNEIKNDYINKQLELIWKKFLDDNPEIFKKISNILDKDNSNVTTIGSVLIANGYYEEAKIWKEYRSKELNKLNIDTKSIINENYYRGEKKIINGILG